MKKVNLSNISLDTIRAFLLDREYRCGCLRNGHEMWVRHDVLRPVILRGGFEPVPEYVVRNMLRAVGANDLELEAFVMRQRLE